MAKFLLSEVDALRAEVKENQDLAAWNGKEGQRQIQEKMDEVERLRAEAKAARELCAKQAEDVGLWVGGGTADEVYIQGALRKLHEVIEGISQEECARKVLAGDGGQEKAMSGEHINADGEFQSDKYPWCRAGFVPLKLTDPMAHSVLWEYAKRREVVDMEFSNDLWTCLRKAGYDGGQEKSDA